MKTLSITRIISVVHFKQKPLCEKRSLLSHLSLWLRVHGFFTVVRTTKFCHLKMTIAHAHKALHAGLVALQLALLAQINRRVYVGLFLMGVIAPVSACFYMLFDRVAFVEGWYHVNYFHLFFLLGPHLFITSCLAGAFLLFPEGSKRAYMLSIPMGYNVAKIIWLIMATSNQDFWAVVPSSILLIGILISTVLFFTLDWLAKRKFHREDAYKARMDNLVKLADEFDDAKFKSMVKTVWQDEKSFQKQY